MGLVSQNSMQRLSCLFGLNSFDLIELYICVEGLFEFEEVVPSYAVGYPPEQREHAKCIIHTGVEPRYSTREYKSRVVNMIQTKLRKQW